MKHLLEIAQLIIRKKGRKIEVFDEGPLSSKNSKFNEFYEALLAGRYKNDRDAATHLYGCSPTDDRYRQLKSRFRKRLLNTLFFLDQNQAATSSQDRAYHACHKEWALVKILLGNEAPHAAADLARGVLNTALKFHFSDLALASTRVLRAYALRYGTEQEFAAYNALVQEYAQQMTAEIRSEEVCQQLEMAQGKLESGRTFRLNGEQLAGFNNELEQLYATHKSPAIGLDFFLLQAHTQEQAGDWTGLLHTVQLAEQFAVQQPHFDHREKLERLRLKKIMACLHRRDFKAGQQAAENLLSATTEGGDTWFAALDGYFLLAMHTGEFKEARAVHAQAFHHAKFRKQPAAEREKWQLYEAYLELFPGENETNGAAQKNSTRPGKPWQEPQAFAKHHRLFAVHHSVTQVISTLAHDNYIGAAGHIDRLKNLANRQFKSSEPVRTQQFIRLLQHLAKAGFAAHDLNGAVQAYADLAQTPFHYRGLVQDLEVVPYERLWQVILDNLE